MTMAMNTPRWFDCHCHLHDEHIPGGATSAIAAAGEAGVAAMLTVGTDAATSAAAIELARANGNVWATVGLHPHDAVQGVESILGLLPDVGGDDDRIVAVGECGLDYHYDHSPRAVQRDAFAAQIALAHARHLPLVIHTRDAWEDTFDILRAEQPPATTVFHCFTGGADEGRRALDLGAHLSFSGIVSFPSAGDVREAAALCPADRLLVETDSPYLAPVPHRGDRNQPSLLPAVGVALAAARGVHVAEIADLTWRNTVIAFSVTLS
jgi:TatD DNase family protein